MQGYHAGGGALLRPGADAAEMAGVADGDDGEALPARPFDAERHRLLGNDLAIAEVAVDDQNRTALLGDPRTPVCAHEPAALPIHVFGDTDDAMGFMADQIGLDEVIGERVRLGCIRTRGGEDCRDDAGERAGFNRRAHAIQSQATILRAVIMSFVAVANDLKWLVSRCAWKAASSS